MAELIILIVLLSSLSKILLPQTKLYQSACFILSLTAFPLSGLTPMFLSLSKSPKAVTKVCTHTYAPLHTHARTQLSMPWWISTHPWKLHLSWDFPLKYASASLKRMHSFLQEPTPPHGNTLVTCVYASSPLQLGLLLTLLIYNIHITHIYLVTVLANSKSCPKLNYSKNTLWNSLLKMFSRNSKNKYIFIDELGIIAKKYSEIIFSRELFAYLNA